MKAEDICQAPRHRALGKLTDYLESKQYRGRPDWWSGTKPNGEVVPLRERAPCIIYPLPRAAVEQLTRFTFGVDKWPNIRVDDDRVAEEQRGDASAVVTAMVDQCGIKPAIRALMHRGLACGTACAVVGVRRGRLVVDIPRAQDCLPEFVDDDPDAEVLRLTWCYQFDKQVDGDCGPELVRHWFRRDIDGTHVTQFVDAPVKHNESPAWKVDAARSYAHGLGFCPVLWMRNMPDGAHGDIDGTSLYAEQLEQFDALNFALSQRHRGIHYFGTPQPYETGVDPDDGPEAEGRTTTGTPGYTPPAGTQPHGAAAAKARRMAPDYMWSYQSADANVALVETTGKAFEVATKHVEDVRSRVLEAMGVVLINQSNILGGASSGGKEMSGRFLRIAFGPMLNLVDELRESCWWPHLQDLIAMAFRVVAMGATGIRVPCAVDVASLHAALGDDEPICLTALWGDSFELAPDEAASCVGAASAARDAGLISRETAANYVAGPFGVSDVAAELETIEHEKAEAVEDAAKAMGGQQPAEDVEEPAEPADSEESADAEEQPE